jgi:hypothetical protein
VQMSDVNYYFPPMTVIFTLHGQYRSSPISL